MSVTYRQGATNPNIGGDGGYHNSDSVTLAGVQAGSVLVLFIAGGDSAGFIDRVYDNNGNTWTLISSKYYNRGQQIWIATNASAGSTTITATTPGLLLYSQNAMTVREYAGASLIAPIGGIASYADVEYVNRHSVSINTTLAGAMVVGFYAGNNGTSSFTPNGGMSNLITANQGDLTGSATANISAPTAGNLYTTDIQSSEFMQGLVYAIIINPPSPANTQRSLESGEDKQFIYKVYDPDGTFRGVWPDVTDEFKFSQALNTPGSTTTVQLGRSAQNTVEVREALTDELGTAYTDETGDPYTATSTTSSTIGPDTDVYEGLRVQVVAVYGFFEPLTDELGVPYTDENGEPYITSSGAPMGRVVFRGEINTYEAEYGSRESVTVELISHGVELTKGEVVKSGAATTVTYSSTALETTAKSVLDTNPGLMTYSADTIRPTGVVETLKFQLNTKLEALKMIYDQTPDGWYWYGNPADNCVYLRPYNTVPDHTFIRGLHISSLKVKRSKQDLRNKIYFLGKDSFYKLYSYPSAVADAGSLGVHRITDRRFTSDTSAKRFADKEVARYGRPIYSSTIEIPATTYDIESIKLGDMIAVRGFGNFVDTLLLPIVNINYAPKKISLDIGELMDRQSNIIADIKDDLVNEQYGNMPTTPS